MKKNILKLTCLLSAFILIISCSNEVENPVEDQVTTTNFFGNQTDIICVNNFLNTDGYCLEYIMVEYEPYMTRQEKQAIRDPYCGIMISIELCDSNPNIEVWTVRGNPDCAKEPALIPPTDPDLKQSARSGSNYFIGGCENQ